MSPSNLPQKNHVGRDKKLEDWLIRVGFERNPFSEIYAECDDYLQEHFIRPNGFEEILGRNSAVFYAPRGGGKTASRRMVEKLSNTEEVKGVVLSVTYDDLQSVVNEAKNALESVTARMHIEAILRNAVPLLFDHLVRNPGLVSNFENLAYLKQFVKQFSNCLADGSLNRALKGTMLTVDRIVDALEDESFESVLNNVAEDYHPRVQYVASLVEQEETRISLDKFTATELLEKFYDLAKTAGFDALFILVDNVDGMPETKSNPGACVTLLCPLVDTEPLIRLRGVFFKFFLPSDAKPLLDKKFEAFSSARIRPVEVNWPPDRLRQILQKRLEAATQAHRTPIKSLEGWLIDIENNVGLKGRIDDELLECSKTPRDLVRLGNDLFQTHIDNSPGKDFITVETFNQALKSARDRQQSQQRQKFRRRASKWLWGSAAVFLVITSFLTWLFFILPLDTGDRPVGDTILSVSAQYPRYLSVGDKNEIVITVRNAGTVVITDVNVTLLYSPTLLLPEDSNVVKFDQLTSNMAQSDDIFFTSRSVPLWPVGVYPVHFNLAVSAGDGTREIVTGATTKIISIPDIVVKYFFLQPLLALLAAVQSGAVKKFADWTVNKIVERAAISRTAAGEDKNNR